MAILATFTSRATATNKNPEGLLSYDSTKNEMLKMQWMPCTELSSMDEKSACRWQSMEDHQIPINLEVIVIDNHHPTAVRGIDHVLVLLDAGKSVCEIFVISKILMNYCQLLIDLSY